MNRLHINLKEQLDLEFEVIFKHRCITDTVQLRIAKDTYIDTIELYKLVLTKLSLSDAATVSILEDALTKVDDLYHKEIQLLLMRE